MKTY
jgi:hypothetical protein